MKWRMRKTVVHDIRKLPYDGDGNLLIEDASEVRLIIPGYVYPVDIGSLCYTKRRKFYKGTSTEKCSLTEVVLSSFKEKRVLFIIGVLDYMNIQLSLGKSANSTKSTYAQLLFFIYWCDKNHIEGLNDLSNCKKAILGYTNHLMHRVRASDLNINTAAAYQLVTITITSSVFNDAYGEITNGLRILKRSHSASNVTSSPIKSDAALLTDTYLSIFNQLTSFTLKFEKFPCKLTIQSENYWFFPNSLPLINRKNKDKKIYLKSKFLAYNYKNGSINSVKEIQSSLNRTSQSNASNLRYAKNIRRIAIENIEMANLNRSHKSRIFGASFAMDSFTMLFCSHTGMNLGQVITIKWNELEEYTIGNERQGFKTIKYRANNKPVSFFIASNFLNTFKMFLKLRKSVLDLLKIEKYEYLFFKVIKNLPRPLNMGLSTHFHKKTYRVFNIEAKITTRQWRCFKSNWLIKNTDINTTALLLQNSPKTVMKHYMEGSDAESTTEFTNYYSNLKNIVIKQKNAVTKNLSIGNCIDYKKPETIDINVQHQPNCNSSNGCLFCNKYAVHADPIDVRKLYSYMYVILQTRILSESDQQFGDVNSQVLNRIDEILKEIISKGTITTEEIDDIKNDIFVLENLSPYWLRKLEMLIELELI